MAAKGAGWSELAELVPHHVLCDVHRNELIAVVNSQRMANEVGRNGRSPRPSPYDLFVARAIEVLNFFS